MKSVIRWFVDNQVAANLLMWILIFGGLVTIPSILIEEFPTVDPRIVQVQVPYPGAAPEEVESGVCQRIEEAIDGVEGIDKIDSTAYEGLCLLIAELKQEASVAKASRDIEARVNAITTLPHDAERPIVSELTITATVLNMALTGNVSPRSLKEIGENIRDELAELPEVSKVELSFTKDYEISVEVSEHTLRQYGLTLGTVAESIRQGSQDVAGGSLKTDSGEILLRTLGQAYNEADLERLVVKQLDDGSIVRLSDIATITDGFVDNEILFQVDGTPAVMLTVSRTGNGNLLRIARHVKEYIGNKQAGLPHGVELAIWKDESQDLVDRLRVLGRNAGGGLLLVLLVLTLFLQPRLAFWVAVGLPIAMIGTLLLFPVFNVSISTVSIMGFILVLGILVDDAIVVGERVHAFETRGYSLRDAAIHGTQQVSLPVIFGVLTTMAAFMPLAVSGSGLSSFLQAVGITAIVALLLSIVESQMILPAHLAHRRQSNNALSTTPSEQGRWTKFQQRMEHGLRMIAKQRYQPVLRRAMEWRYFTLAIAVSVVVLVLTLFASGRAVFQFFPSVEADRVYATLIMPPGTPIQVLQREAEKLKVAALQLRDELDKEHAPEQQSNIRRILKAIGGKIARGSIDFDGGPTNSNHVELVLELIPYKERGSVSPGYIAHRWRELTPPIADAVALNYTANFFSIGDAIDIRLRGPDTEQLRAAARDIKLALTRFDGVSDITDSFRAGKQEIKFTLKDQAPHLGINSGQLGRQIRNAFYGEEVQRVQRSREDIRIMVRYPKSERHSMSDVQNMRVRTPQGEEIALGNVANLDLGRGFSSIRRLDRQRVISVTADVDRDMIEPERVLNFLDLQVKPQIYSRYPGIEYSLGGEAEESADSFNDLSYYTALALLLIYALLAIPLQSYSQPLIIMSVIPFGAVGAILGHFIMGKPLVFFSLLGIVALSGVVINSSLVLVDNINRLRREGAETVVAISDAAVERFRPIVLTSITTFVGLVPLIIDQNPTTYIFIPMAISLSFGVVFATVITLFLVPCLYMLLAEAGSKSAGIEAMPVKPIQEPITPNQP
ncbi:MAG: efflux RND transporter permease subunit [Pseudomonadota bacterium]